MTAGYETTIPSNRNQGFLQDAIGRATSALRNAHPQFRPVETDDGRTVLRVRPSLRSWGETVVIEPGPGGIRILSECRIFQWVDFGKNRENVQRVRALIVRELK